MAGNTLHVHLYSDCLIRVLSIICSNFSKIFPIMLALCLMPLVTYYAQNYAGIISWSLLTTKRQTILREVKSNILAAQVNSQLVSLI